MAISKRDLVYLEELTRAAMRGCDSPNCNHKKHNELFMHCRRHSLAPIEASFLADIGGLRIGCRKCGRVIACVAIAAKFGGE